MVNLGERYLGRYPGEMSGGEKQRIGIARAFAGSPRLVICDEPTSALDVSVQAAILNALIALQARHGTSYLFISHDLGVVRQVAHHVAVIQHGRIVETGSPEQVFGAPRQPYTRLLIAAIPTLEPGPGIRRPPHEGPSPDAFVPGALLQMPGRLVPGERRCRPQAAGDALDPRPETGRPGHVCSAREQMNAGAVHPPPDPCNRVTPRGMIWYSGMKQDDEG